MNRSGLILLFALAANSAFSGPIQAQTPVIRANVEVVNVVCTVRDRKGRYIDDLTKDDFQIFEDGVPQKIDYFQRENGENAQPLTILMLIDTSGSVKDKLAFEQRAAGEFLRQTLRPKKDMAAIIQFDSDINLVQDFTYDLDTLENAILDIRAGGATKLYDAIWLSVQDMLSKEVGRKILVILSDGADTQSMVDDQTAIEAAQKQDVVIFGIGVRSRHFDSDFGKLEKFAKATGGAFFNSKARLDRLRDAFSRINREIKNQYSLGYTSTNTRRDGSFRKIVIKVKRRHVKINHRRGYYAAAAKRS